MPRTMTTGMQAAVCAPNLYPALFVAMQFATDTVYLWSGQGNVTWNSMNFLGIGTLGSISTISEDSTVEAKGIVLTMSGIPSGMVSEILTETRVLGTVNVWLGLFTPAGVLIADPIQAYQGKMDQPSIEDDGDTCSISLNVENVLVDLNRECYRRYCDADQQIDLAATLTRLGMPSNTVDTGFTHVPMIQELQVFWGSTPRGTNQ
jgi:hypothetical protein